MVRATAATNSPSEGGNEETLQRERQHGRPGASAAREAGGSGASGSIRGGVRRSPRIVVPGSALDLCAACRPGRSRHRRPPAPRHPAGRPSRALPAEHPVFRDLLLRRAEGRGGRGQLQSALCRPRAAPADRRLLHDDDDRARHRRDLRQGAGTAAHLRPAAHHRLPVRRGAAAGQARCVHDAETQDGRASRLEPPGHPLPPGRRARPASCAGGDRSGETWRCCNIPAGRPGCRRVPCCRTPTCR